MIKNILKALFVAVAIIAAIFVVFNIYAKDFIVGRVENAYGIKVGLEKISLNFPLSVELRGLKLGQALSAGRINVAVNPFGFIAGKILLDKVLIVDPIVAIEQSSQGKLNLPKFSENKGKTVQIFASRIIIKNGVVDFTDKKVVPEGFKVVLNKINVDAAKVMLPPTSLKTKFNASCEMDRPDSQVLGKLALNGWVDFGSKDAEAVFTMQGLEATYFTPYFGDFLSSRKLESATVDLVSQLKARNNDLTVNNDFNLSNLKYAQEEDIPGPGELPEFDLTKKTLDLFTDRSGNLKLSFEIKTKLDQPGISQEELKKIMLNAAMKNLANQDPVDIFQKVSSIIEQASKYGKQMKDIFTGKADPDEQVTGQNQ
ncbi:MAG: DUF748 domain-containing protein [Candidatus Omnitrophota bacterium]